MLYRDFGETGLQISEISHGTWAMGYMWGARDDAQSLRALKLGLEKGINFIDTAWLYGKGHAERLIGKVLRESKQQAYVATKCPPKNMVWPPRPGIRVEEAFPSDYFIQITETSLKNLGVERLDLQQFHVWNEEWLEQGDWQETVARLKAEGKIRHFGVSLNDHQADSGLSLVQSGLVDSIQVIYNLFDSSARERLFPLCREKKVGVLARVPLDEGGLSGKLDRHTVFPKSDWRNFYFKEERLVETAERAEKFSFLIRGEIRNLAQAAIKFCLAEPAVSAVLCGMRQTAHVEENTRIPELAGFSEAELKKAYALAWPRNYYLF
jgi:aryl-alcohol dehydrogenase-like predicted oxidoreductase